jgi:uncharacterized OsmC-like protein
METVIKHVEQARFEVRARQHVIYSDQPIENGGQDSAMTPPELFLASLGSCAAYYAAQFLLHTKLADHGVEVSVAAEKLKDPPRLGKFVIRLKSPVPLTPDQIVGMERSVHKCLIHQTLLNAPQIEISVDHLSELPGLEVIYGSDESHLNPFIRLKTENPAYRNSSLCR